ncbi:E3 SUMO-protein ligase ZBED1-like [Frankliniella occidentalis]|uniref:E3 SUMO-protein ligase ZBED1-like n=1 Tax=Frankliniella occidentalis TaxID=133901 RepID=A0A9C6WXZ2_FRAOC|nr:E3 SUMO-protein ligase ZBED1-like [Frankliniella occidentalis]
MCSTKGDLAPPAPRPPGRGIRCTWLSKPVFGLGVTAPTYPYRCCPRSTSTASREGTMPSPSPTRCFDLRMKSIEYFLFMFCFTDRASRYRQEVPDDPGEGTSSGPSDRRRGGADGLRASGSGDRSRSGSPATKRARANVRPMSHERQEVVTQAIAGLIAACQLPISIVDSEGFTNFMKVLEPSYKVPCATTMRKRLHELFCQVRENVQVALNELDFISLTTDCWTSRALDSYISLTAQAITKTWELRRYTLCTEGMDVNHSGDNLALALIDMCHEWDLEGRATSITRDNATNIVNAVNQVDFVEFNVSCAAHLLQLCVNDGLKKNKPFMDACKKAKKVVAHFHHSTKATTALEAAQVTAGLKEAKLVQSCSTRWDSTYLMCKSLTESRAPVCAVLSDRNVTTAKQSRTLQMSAEEWAELEAMLPALKPLQVATTVLCADDKVTVSTVRPVVRSLLDVHFKLDDEGLLELDPCEEHVRDFKVEVSRSLTERFNMDASAVRPVEVQQLAAFLDPRYKDLRAEPSPAEAEKIRDLAKQKMAGEAAVAVDQDAEGEAPAAGSGLDFLFCGEAEAAGARTWQAEYAEYVAEPQISHNQCPLTWWKTRQKRYPTLARLARRYLAVPATSASSERDFSTAGNTVRPNRSCLLPENVSILVFLFQNRNFVLKLLGMT